MTDNTRRHEVGPPISSPHLCKSENEQKSITINSNNPSLWRSGRRCIVVNFSLSTHDLTGESCHCRRDWFCRSKNRFRFGGCCRRCWWRHRPRDRGHRASRGDKTTNMSTPAFSSTDSRNRRICRPILFLFSDYFLISKSVERHAF